MLDMTERGGENVETIDLSTVTTGEFRAEIRGIVSRAGRERRGVNRHCEGMYFWTDEEAPEAFGYHTGAPCCLLGAWLHYRGITAERFFTIPSGDGASLNYEEINELVGRGAIRLTPAVCDLATELQEAQDQPHRWGTAIDRVFGDG